MTASMTTLTQALSIEPGDCVAVVGAGGKTTLCWRLAQAVRGAHGLRVIFTTTTRIWQPADGAFDMMHIRPHPIPLPLGEGVGWRTACMASAIDGAVNLTPVNGAGMPTVQTKLAGYSAEDICALHSTLYTPRSTLIVEADGARGLRIKAPGEGEPVIPPCASMVCVLANLDAIGRPLDERVAHRVDRIAQLTHTTPGALITAPLITALLAHPDGGLKGIPAGAKKVAVLTQQGDTCLHADAAQIMQTLVERGFDRAVAVAPRAAQPLLAEVMAIP
jgi:molybdenum cofactor cytidylyltransferase